MKTVTILHGWTYSLDKWEPLVGLLRQSGFNVESLEIPGLTSKSAQVWDLEKYSEWLNRKIKNSSTILIGHSNGGRIAAFFAARHPKKVEKLILIDSAGIYHKNLYIRVKRLVFGVVAKIGKMFTKSESLRKILYKIARERDYLEASPNMRLSMANLIRVDLTDVYKRITTKTLIIWGDEDRVTPVSDAHVINRCIKNSKLEIISGAGHSPFYSHADRVFVILNKFLK